MSNNDSWDEHRLLVLANFERHDADIEALKKEVQKLRETVRDHNWKMIIIAIIGGIGGGIGGGGGVDLLKIVLSGMF